MANEITPITQSDNQIVLYQPNETLSLEVKLEAAHETVWLTQQQIADLFGTKRPAITKHLSNIFKSGELDQNSVSSILEHTAADGKVYKTQFYNLDAIISVGYRVNSVNATAFRRWATNVLRDHLFHGYTINRQLVALQERVDNRFTALEQRLDKHDEQIAFFIRTNQPPIEGVFFDNQMFDALALLEELVKKAHTRIILIDDYVDARILQLFHDKAPSATIDCYVKHLHQTATMQSAFTRFHTQHPTIHCQLHTFELSHDRWLILDDQLYNFGASLKDLGKRWFSFALINDPGVKAHILSELV